MYSEQKKYLRALTKGLPDGSINSESLEDRVYFHLHKLITESRAPIDLNNIDGDLISYAVFLATEELILEHLEWLRNQKPKKKLRWKDQAGAGTLVVVKEIPNRRQGSYHSSHLEHDDYLPLPLVGHAVPLLHTQVTEAGPGLSHHQVGNHLPDQHQQQMLGLSHHQAGQNLLDQQQGPAVTGPVHHQSSNGLRDQHQQHVPAVVSAQVLGQLQSDPHQGYLQSYPDSQGHLCLHSEHKVQQQSALLGQSFLHSDHKDLEQAWQVGGQAVPLHPVHAVEAVPPVIGGECERHHIQLQQVRGQAVPLQPVKHQLRDSHVQGGQRLPPLVESHLQLQPVGGSEQLRDYHVQGGHRPPPLAGSHLQLLPGSVSEQLRDSLVHTLHHTHHNATHIATHNDTRYTMLHHTLPEQS